ncbi:MAG: hypothetical protein JO292_08230 [Betaproteobacteria bacterium]|nr:hypothetical protein [Betaproteobacteria bacterium]MBV9361365.1 hypothetical protein [Betaproteobacteria bacterium]
MSLRSYLVIAAMAAAPAIAQQQQGAPQKTTEQQARSYVASAFITGAAPVIMSDKVIVSPSLRQHLGLGPDADGAAVYKAVMNITGGKQVTVRRAAADEISASEAPAPVSQQPIFAVEAGNSTLIVQYDLGHDNISFVGLPGAVATAAPVMAPVPPEKVADTPTVVPTAAPAVAATGTVAATTGTVVEKTPPPPPSAPVDAPKPAPMPEQKPLQVVEPSIPRATKPAPAVAVAPRPAQPVMMMQEPKLPPLKPNGPCVIKPVMSDQDLVNCGATPR